MAYSKGEAEGSGETGLFTQMWAGLSQLPEAVKCLGCYYLWVRIKNVCVSAGVGVGGRAERFHLLESGPDSIRGALHL